MPMHNCIEYSDNYSHPSGSIWQFKRNEVPDNNADLGIDNSQPCKYKAAFIGKTKDVVGGNSFLKHKNVPLKYLSNFWRSLGMS